MGGEKRLKQREEIENIYKWNIGEMYTDEALWESKFLGVKAMASAFGAHAGHLGDSAEALLAAFKERDALWLKLEHLYVYARMKQDEDNRADRYQSLNMRAETLMNEAAAQSSFFTPELLSIPEKTLMDFISEDKGLMVYEHAIKDILRQKAHVLSETEETLLAQFGEISGAAKSIFGMINNADMKFGIITDEDGDQVELTHGNYITFMESHNRAVRESAFRQLYNTYEKQKNTLATTYNFNTKKNVMFAGIRRYDSALASALSSDNIEKEVYTSLIDSINNHLGSIYKYVEIRKKMLGVEKTAMYDMYVPLVERPKREVPFEEALEIMYDGLAPLGDAYIADVKRGVASGWIDVYENEGKTSGAYSFGSYNSMPYILMNYSGKLKDVFTIAHEMGHSMNSYYTRKKQPFIYGGHSIFTAEVASTVNECLLMQHLLNNCKDEREKIYLLNLYIEEFRTTVFRQTMFAEFEKMTHEAVGRGEVLTADRLCKEYGELNRKYFGPNVICDKEIEMEWSRIPHFYNAFYVYKYATGYSAAVAISNNILNKGQYAVDAYLDFLAKGESDYPVELLKGAGVDMGKPDVVDSAMKTFDGLVDQLEELV